MDVTKDHVIAAQMFRCDWDIAEFGLTDAGGLAGGGSGQPAGPRTGPKPSAVARLRSSREVGRVLRMVGEDAVPLFLWVVVSNADIPAWCSHQAERTGRKPDPKKEFGRLIATLDRLRARLGLRRGDAVDVVARATSAATGRPVSEVLDLIAGPDPTDDAALVRLAQDLTALEEKAHRP